MATQLLTFFSAAICINVDLHGNTASWGNKCVSLIKSSCETYTASPSYWQVLINIQLGGLEKPLLKETTAAAEHQAWDLSISKPTMKVLLPTQMHSTCKRSLSWELTNYIIHRNIYIATYYQHTFAYWHGSNFVLISYAIVTPQSIIIMLVTPQSIVIMLVTPQSIIILLVIIHSLI